MGIEIAASPEVVFDWVDDDEKLPLWLEGLEQIEYPDGVDRNNPVGTRFRHTMRRGRKRVEYEGHVTE